MLTVKLLKSLSKASKFDSSGARDSDQENNTDQKTSRLALQSWLSEFQQFSFSADKREQRSSQTRQGLSTIHHQCILITPVRRPERLTD